jgi:sulfane dehydrogenase subunit SoxC
MSRAVDETGYAQPTKDVLIASRGTSSVGYHTNPITGWQIRSDGTVIFRPEPWA